MITAKEAYRIARYENPQKDLVYTAVEKLIKYIEDRTINESQQGNFKSAFTVRQHNLHRYGLSDKLSERSIRETIEKVAYILEENGYNIYYEEDYIQWSWKFR